MNNLDCPICAPLITHNETKYMYLKYGWILYLKSTLNVAIDDDNYDNTDIETNEQLIEQYSRLEWKTGVIYYNNFPQVEQLDAWKKYATKFEYMQTKFIIILETDELKTIHLHYVLANNQRADNCTRTLNKNIPITATEIRKITCQKIKNFKAILQYLTKDPKIVFTNDQTLLKIFTYLQNTPINDAKTIIQKVTKLKDFTHILTHLIPQYNIKNYQEAQQKFPELFEKFLHIPQINTIFQNTYEFLQNKHKHENIKTYMQNLKTCKNTNSNHIKHILNEQNIDIKLFTETVYKIITKQNGKKNTLVLEGIPNSGKSTIARSILEMFPSYGEIVNNSNFMFQDLIEKEIGIWEEPIINETNVEKCKLILEGAKTAIDIKFKQPTTINQIPIIITTNHTLWHWTITNKQAIIQRCTFFEFIKAITFDGINKCPDTNINDNINTSNTGHNSTDERTNTELNNINNRKRTHSTDGNGNNNKETRKKEKKSNETISTNNSNETNKNTEQPITLHSSLPDTHLIPHLCDWIQLFKEYGLVTIHNE